MCMKTKEKTSARGRKPEPALRGRKRLEDIVPNKDVKNEGRSDDVYENKHTHDTMTEDENDFVSENASILKNLAVFEEQFGIQALNCRVFRCGYQRQ